MLKAYILKLEQILEHAHNNAPDSNKLSDPIYAAYYGEMRGLENALTLARQYAALEVSASLIEKGEEDANE